MSFRLRWLMRWAGLLAVLVCCWISVGGTAAAEEEILSFDVTVEVLADGELEVTETIRVRAEGRDIRRGIYRDIPLTFVDGGRSRRVTFDLLEVARDGEPEPHHTNSNSHGIRIYAGDADVFLDPDVYTYRFRYRTGRQIRFLPEHTELFWNVTGNEWSFPIRAGMVHVILPDGAAPARWTAFTGRAGERGRDFEGSVLDDNSLVVRTSRSLDRYEGFSVALEIPPGVVAAPTGRQKFGYWFLDNRRTILGTLGLLVVLALYVTIWRAVGRDPPKGTIIPRFHPPTDVSPALAAYVRNYGWTNGWREFTAATLSLAVKGYLVFDDAAGTIVLTRGSDPPATGPALPPGERAILAWVDRRGGEVAIDKKNGKSVASALTAFKSNLEKENRGRFFKLNRGYFALGVATTLVVLVLTLVFGGLDENEVPLLFAIPFAGAIFGSIVMPMVRALKAGTVRSIIATGAPIVALAAMSFLFLSIAGGSLRSLPTDFAGSALDAFLQNGFPFALIGGLAAMNGLFYYLLRAPTAAGREVMDEIEGLELYIRTAETERMNLAGAPDLDTEQFERLLPYAVALEAEEPWSEAFASAFARAHPGEEVSSSYQPGWYGRRGWGDGDFGRSIASTVSAAQGSFASSVPAPKSSSSGFSGGSSGGGGGGGGGGGW